MRPTRALRRLAQRLHTVYEQRHVRGEQDRRSSDWHRLAMRYDDVQRLHGLIEKAESHGWHLAACKHKERLSVLLGALSEAAHEVRDDWLEHPAPPPQLKDLRAELQHLEIEFGDIVIARKGASITVQTDAIVLEEIKLGRFSIRLHWLKLAEKSDVDCFEIVALDPNPAANSESVTHPHVKDQHLCAGDASIPIQKALAQGRFVDAFCLVRCVLQTYNAKSAYTSLEEWNGVSCWNCGSSTNADDAYFCESCSHDVCSDCTSTCLQCDRTYCASCQTRCPECESPCCRRCLKTSEHSETSCCADCLKVCAACGAKVAASEFDEATERCPDCLDEETEVEAENDVSLPTSSSNGDHQ